MQDSLAVKVKLTQAGFFGYLTPILEGKGKGKGKGRGKGKGKGEGLKFYPMRKISTIYKLSENRVEQCCSWSYGGLLGNS